MSTSDFTVLIYQDLSSIISFCTIRYTHFRGFRVLLSVTGFLFHPLGATLIPSDFMNLKLISATALPVADSQNLLA